MRWQKTKIATWAQKMFCGGKWIKKIHSQIQLVTLIYVLFVSFLFCCNTFLTEWKTSKALMTTKYYDYSERMMPLFSHLIFVVKISILINLNASPILDDKYIFRFVAIRQVFHINSMVLNFPAMIHYNAHFKFQTSISLLNIYLIELKWLKIGKCIWVLLGYFAIDSNDFN